MRSVRRLTLASLLTAGILTGCEGGSSAGPAPIAHYNVRVSTAAEMQPQTVFYAASGGSTIRVLNASVVQ